MTEYWPEDPTQRGDDVAYAMREFYEANRPLRWWEKRNPPGAWGGIADNLMLGLRNIVLNAEREHELASADTRRMAETTEIGSVRSTSGAVGEAETPKPSQGAEQQQCRSGR